MIAGPTTITASVLIGPEAVDNATAHVHTGHDGAAIGAVRIPVAGGSGFTLQAGHADGGPDALAVLLDTLAAHVREQHALYLTRNSNGALS